MIIGYTDDGGKTVCVAAAGNVRGVFENMLSVKQEETGQSCSLKLCVCVCVRYLEVEWEVRKGTQRSFGKDVMRGSSPRVPQQDNFSDCGVYILQYVESFFEVREEISSLWKCLALLLK